MPRDGSLVFGDLFGRLTTLVVVCDKCGRHGRYSVARLVERLGPDAKMTDWLSRIVERFGADAKLTDWLAWITADCPKRRSVDMSDQCGAQPGSVAGDIAAQEPS